MPFTGPKGAAGPRIMLRQLREAMAARMGTQQRFDRVVHIIASNMVADVCSCYLVRGDDALELYATEGLNQKAVHKAQLKVGEGLVGAVVKRGIPLNLRDAQSHPNFVYLPETGEDPYQSFLGVPLARGGRNIGVLVVQNRTQRIYTDEEEEALQTVAMVLAETMVAGQFLDPDSVLTDKLRRREPMVQKGVAFADGIALGEIVFLQPRLKASRLIADDIDAERIRLDEAVEELRASIADIMHEADKDLFGESLEVLQTYQMFANDVGWINRLREWVASGLSAEMAVEREHQEMRRRLGKSSETYLRERLHDFEDLSDRLLRHLIGVTVPSDLPDQTILVARNLGPAELLEYDRDKLAGVLLEEGSQSTHVTIVAKALNLPLVGKVADVLDNVEAGDFAVVDGESGDVHLRPKEDVIRAYEDKLELLEKRQAGFADLRNQPARTLDGETIDLFMNAGLLVDLPHLEEVGADGIGLFRTELQFLVSAAMPRLTAQTQLYREVLEAAGDKPVTFRAVDLGGDKVLPYLEAQAEENPAMGWRSIRLALDRPGLLRYQMRAFLNASAGKDLRIMFPLVAEVSEFKAAREMFERELSWIANRGRPVPKSVALGTMLEVPSLGFQLPALLDEVDFVSIGSNDLIQFLFAADRENPKLVDRYDALSPAPLNFLKIVLDACEAKGVPLSLCGEMAGRPLEALALIALGFRQISMPPASIGPVKQMIMHLNAEKAQDLMLKLLESPVTSLRPQLQAFAEEEGIPVS